VRTSLGALSNISGNEVLEDDVGVEHRTAIKPFYGNVNGKFPRRTNGLALMEKVTDQELICSVGHFLHEAGCPAQQGASRPMKKTREKIEMIGDRTGVDGPGRSWFVRTYLIRDKGLADAFAKTAREIGNDVEVRNERRGTVVALSGTVERSPVVMLH
jgi:hypothetical protein